MTGCRGQSWWRSGPALVVAGFLLAAVLSLGSEQGDYVRGALPYLLLAAYGVGRLACRHGRPPRRRGPANA